MIACNHTKHLGTIVDNSIIQLLASSTIGRKHHLIGSLEVFFVADVLYVAIRAISLLHNSQLQLISQIIEVVAHLLHLLRFVVPLFHLLGVLLHLYGKVVVDDLILQTGILRSTLQALLHNGEAVEHLSRDVQCQHRHQDDVHQVNHLLARRNGSFLDCHILPLTSYI